MSRRPFYYLKNKNSKQAILETPILTPEYIESVRSVSYLGKKGYTIPKSALKKEDDEYLRKELLVKPMMFGVCAPIRNAFPVFRENTNKIYLPRFYGIKRYGLPDRCEIQDGVDISLEFTKPLRDYQEKIIDVYMNYVNTPICKNNETCNGSGGILEVPCGRGKCLGKDTLILMYDGSLKCVQDVVIGDILMGDDNKPRNVLSTCTGKEKMVNICELENFKDSYTCNMSHILSLVHSISGETLDLSIEEYLAHPEKDMLLGYRVPISFNSQTYDLGDPYKTGYFSNDYNLDKYICNSRDVQLEFLAGIMDQYHSKDKTVYRISIPIKTSSLVKKILYTCRSLGFHVIVDYLPEFIMIDIHSTKHANISEIQTHVINISDYEDIALIQKTLTYKFTLYMLDEERDYYGFEIDGNRRFMLGDFSVTHNTVMALKIISLVSKKTLILVHKEFLMNQWIERIGEFLPAARVGKIQASTFDVENKDIVIGMIQSLYDKEYSAGTFDSFGLTIIDEVHRIGSEQFSRTLFKTITPYMLGISATVDRKDKLTNVLYMFIGDKIYEEKRENDDPVCVRAITYRTIDGDFNEVEVDFRGNTKYSTMITKLCEFGPRSDFIVRVIADLIEEEPENQIMVLCHNRSLLTYLYEAICHRDLTSVGYYVGGMKQDKLQETEAKQIVLATYAMAAEALDIKSLSTLVMVTPKTDITQSIGRILRVKHANPIVVDIVDSHEIFQNQWTQRKRFYKKCNYRIRQIESSKYSGMAFDWNSDQTWKRVYEPKESTVCEKEPNEQLEDAKKVKCMIDPSMFSGL
jgi:superfamily II DNA or RNA helicase